MLASGLFQAVHHHRLLPVLAPWGRRRVPAARAVPFKLWRIALCLAVCGGCSPFSVQVSSVWRKRAAGPLLPWCSIGLQHSGWRGCGQSMAAGCCKGCHADWSEPLLKAQPQWRC